MKQRLLTPEEAALWRHDNRATQPLSLDVPVEDVAMPEAAPTPPRAMSPALPVVPAIPSTIPKTALRVLSGREAAKHFTTHPEATLDLHGMHKIAAYQLVGEFIRKQQTLGRRHVAIITGKGRGGEVGVLRHHLPHWLNEAVLRPCLSALGYAKPEKGGNGVLHVLMKKNND